MEAKPPIQEKSTSPVEDLFKKGILKRAELPKNNSETLEKPKMMLTPIDHDYQGVTPCMWNAVYNTFGIEAGSMMVVGDPAQARKIFETFKKDKKYIGGGVGSGFKDKIPALLDEMDPIAEQIGASNIVVKTPNGKLRGYNTDGLGYIASLEKLLAQKEQMLASKKIIMLGAGGTGNAIAFVLAQRGANLIILNRSVDKAQTLAEKINKYFELKDKNIVRFGGEDFIEEEVKDADIILNVSTKGATGKFQEYSALAPAQNPSEEDIKANKEQSSKVFDIIRKDAIISDINLRGETKTPLLAQAIERGLQTLDGVLMVVNQGVEAVWLLHGKELEAKGITKKQVYEVMKNAAGL